MLLTDVPREGQILSGSLFSEPMRVETVAPNGPSAWTVGLVGTKSQQFRRLSLTKDQLATLTILSPSCSNNGDAGRLKLGLQAYALGIAWEYDPARGQRQGRRQRGGSMEDVETRRDATTLDRVHAAMLLQASGAANALRSLLQSEVERGPEFLRLANALSALYPTDSEEKRLLDAMLLAVPR